MRLLSRAEGTSMPIRHSNKGAKIMPSPVMGLAENCWLTRKRSGNPIAKENLKIT